jgi:integrase
MSVSYNTRRAYRSDLAHFHLVERLSSGAAVSLIVKHRVAATGVDPSGFSGHSLRAGFATSAAQAGASTLKIRAQTGHASDIMLARYIRDGEIFIGNAAGVVL